MPSLYQHFGVMQQPLYLYFKFSTKTAIGLMLMQIEHLLINTAWSDAITLILVNSKDMHYLRLYNSQVYYTPNGFCPILHQINLEIAREHLCMPRDVIIGFAWGNLKQTKKLQILDIFNSKNIYKRTIFSPLSAGENLKKGA